MFGGREDIDIVDDDDQSNIRHQSRPDDDHYEDAIESKTLDSHSDIFRLFCLRNNGTCLQSLVVFKILSQAAMMSES